MRYQEYPPPAALAGYVRFFWVMEGAAAAPDPGRYRLFANGCPELIFLYRSRFLTCLPDGGTTPFPLMHVSGQTHHYREMAATGPFGILGACLYPYSLQAFFGCRAGEFTNANVDTTLLIGSRAWELMERIGEAAGDREKVQILAGFLLDQLGRHTPPQADIQACIRQVVHARGGIRVAQLAQWLNLSNRQLERRFLACTGIPPKLFARITRFQQAIRVHAQQPHRRLTALAMECGYSDQAHFIRDFRAFSGLSPKDYFSESLDDVADGFMKMS